MVTAKDPGPALVLLMMNSDWVPARFKKWCFVEQLQAGIRENQAVDKSHWTLLNFML